MRRLLAAAVLLAPAGRSASAAPVVVVAADSDAAPYREALDGVCAALGACQVLGAGGRVFLPSDARVVVAIGGRAARARYPARVTLVTALTPGYEARARAEDGPVVRVGLTLSPAEFARRLKAARPGARAAALLWSQSASGRFAADARRAAAPLGLDLRPVEIADPDDLPVVLRSLAGIDAIWLAPDASLVTPNAFETVREYARDGGKAFFAPAAGLAGPGVEPGLAPSFRACGWRAGLAAREALERRAETAAYADREPPEAGGGGMILSTASAAAPAR